METKSVNYGPRGDDNSLVIDNNQEKVQVENELHWSITAGGRARKSGDDSMTDKLI